MKKFTLFSLLIITGCWCKAQTKDLSYFVSESRKAYDAKDYTRALEMTSEAHKLHPYHQGILYQMGVLCVLNKKPSEAIPYLRSAILINAEFKLTGNPDLLSVSQEKEFGDLVQLQADMKVPVVNSDTAFTIFDRTLHVESIAFDPKTKTFYLGCIHKKKIIAVGEDGSPRDFITSGQDGLASVFGVRVDEKRRLLWACSSAVPEMESYDSAIVSTLSAFDLNSGKLVNQYKPTTGKGHVFGDLVLNQRGEPFVSDSKNNIIFTVNRETKSLVPFLGPADFWNLQGLAFASDDKYLFVADYIKGIFRVDMRTRQIDTVLPMINVSIKGIDGLLFYKNSLITIQNGTNPARTTRFQLDKTLTRITLGEVLDSNHPAFGEPTIGTITKGMVYYVATSQWGGYDKQHNLLPNDKLKDVVILKSNLK